MILGIGNDIIEIGRVARLMRKFGDAFERKILTERESGQMRRRANSTAYLAKRFAAKEAVSKALGTGMGQGASFRDIEIINTDNGKPEVCLYGAAKRTLESLAEGAHVHISISDTKTLAFAFVVISH